MFDFVNKWFGGGFNARIIKQYQKIVDLINNYESKISILSDEDLAHKTIEFKELLANGKTLDDILPEAFAVVREASKRVLGMRHFDVQLIGGIALHKGQIAEMRTGEGKTLVATSPVYLNALSGKGVHVVTVNDYLAKRDGEQMGQVYSFLGLTTSIIVSGMSDFKKKEAYAADITYGTNHEFGFDYLRDNLKFRVEDMVMRPFNYAVVDEVDSILIDEARTPLIISGPDDNASQMYVDVNSVVKDITEEDYEKDAKTRAINLTEAGIAKIEKRLMDMGLIESPLYDSSNVSMVYYVNCALKANKLFKRDVDYMVKNGQILIIDEFTGRAMEGRRYSEGLHQALEAKEGVEVQAESQTIASISYQNLFRMYPKLSGMTGTAMTEEAEFDEIYKLKVVTIPPNKPVIRKDHEDSIFLTLEEKDKAVIQLIKECSIRRQPVLVGTTNLDRSEYISLLLNKAGVKHNVLNAKQHEREAIIISEAGAPGAVTIATNMAGRGTDIKLGGSVETRIALECKDIEDPIEREERIQQIKEDVDRKHEEVIKLGGLFVVGTERNESRRIDNQLRGRSGRQGDPGASKYFLSLEDDLIKRFGSPNLKNMLKKLGVKQGEDLTHRWISKAIEKAQQRVEAYNFDIRKHLLKYDDVMNEQRKMIYSQRLNLMQSDDLSEYVDNIIFDTVDNLCDLYTSPEAVPFEWKLDDLQKHMNNIFDIQINKDEIANNSNMTYELLKQQLHDMVQEKFDAIKEKIDPEYLKGYEKNLTLRTLDSGWKKHLVTLEHLRRGINLQSYAQKNPLNEYKFEAFNIFDEMLNGVRKEIATNIMHLHEQPQQQLGFDDELDDFDFDDEEDAKSQLQKLLAQLKEIKEKSIPIHSDNNEDNIEFAEENNFIDKEDNNTNQVEQNNNYVVTSRNSPCPCGSGLKYKECHGKLRTIVFNNTSSNNQDVISKNNNDQPIEEYNESNKDIAMKTNEDNNIIDITEVENDFKSNDDDNIAIEQNSINTETEEENDDTFNNLEHNNSKYDTPQDILFKFANDQRKAVFGNDSIDNNTTIDETDNNITTLYKNNNEVKKDIKNEKVVTKKKRIKQDNVDINNELIDNNATIKEEKPSRKKKLVEDNTNANKKIIRKKKILDDSINEINNIEQSITKKKISRKKNLSERKKDNIEQLFTKQKSITKDVIDNIKQNNLEDIIQNKEDKKAVKTRKKKVINNNIAENTNTSHTNKKSSNKVSLEPNNDKQTSTTNKKKSSKKVIK
ncbi:MAG: preprotein translocase subunit SecA [Alphaproteobacteria bacterium]|nr:preprotein translocase subunit SecA [Alphaproteobacteria bacterium]